MIRQFNPKKALEFEMVLDFIKSNLDEDFYVTKNNQRIYIDNPKNFKQLLKETSVSYVIEGECEHDYEGILVLWKSSGGETTRYYVKILAKDAKAVKDLLTIISWNHNTELYVKLQKNNKFLETYKKQGFRFKGGRGKQLLLHRDKPTNKKRFLRRKHNG